MNIKNHVMRVIHKYIIFTISNVITIVLLEFMYRLIINNLFNIRNESSNSGTYFFYLILGLLLGIINGSRYKRVYIRLEYDNELYEVIIKLLKENKYEIADISSTLKKFKLKNVFARLKYLFEDYGIINLSTNIIEINISNKSNIYAKIVNLSRD